MANWVDGLILTLDQKKQISFVDTVGQTVVVTVEKTVVDFIRDNQARLLLIGYDIFKEFLGLLAKRQEFDALVLVFSQLDNSELINKYKEDTVKLAEIAVEIQANCDFWIVFGKQVGFKVAGALLTLLI